MGTEGDKALAAIRAWGGVPADLALFIWPHLTDEYRDIVGWDGAWDPWAMADSVLAFCPDELAIPEQFLTAFEDEAKELAAQDDVWGRMALETIKRYRADHARTTAGANP
ncbi:hypothetical protein H8R18_01060 [Nanchangia anserum]|uniref:Uncharacterized protein n=1 Tax=Nanchangia anserum TaxID=2692125 RepID=A0A8I0KRX1_9ACTO|nr:hypothetical protein [Nanchangia anserum]MBD3689827.1 hypothetical protein [Nanchangia anserum]QOX81997.1 hypothetical protein H8R18_01060 [Nanchangia anserum]